MSTKEMYIKQYRFKTMPTDVKISEISNKVINAVKEIGLASDDDIVEKIVPHYKDNLNPQNVSRLSMRQRMEKVAELRKTATTVMDINSSLKRLIEIGCIIKEKG